MTATTRPVLHPMGTLVTYHVPGRRGKIDRREVWIGDYHVQIKRNYRKSWDMIVTTRDLTQKIEGVRTLGACLEFVQEAQFQERPMAFFDTYL